MLLPQFVAGILRLKDVHRGWCQSIQGNSDSLFGTFPCATNRVYLFAFDWIYLFYLL
jgi:hypothetical protein